MDHAQGVLAALRGDFAARLEQFTLAMAAWAVVVAQGTFWQLLVGAAFCGIGGCFSRSTIAATLALTFRTR